MATNPNQMMLYEVVIHRKGEEPRVVATNLQANTMASIVAKWEKECRREGDRIEVVGNVKVVLNAVTEAVKDFQKKMGRETYKRQLKLVKS